jgi:hypothetical protein
VIVHEPGVEEELARALTDGYRARFARDVTLLPTIAAQGAEALRLD